MDIYSILRFHDERAVPTKQDLSLRNDTNHWMARHLVLKDIVNDQSLNQYVEFNGIKCRGDVDWCQECDIAISNGLREGG